MSNQATETSYPLVEVLLPGEMSSITGNTEKESEVLETVNRWWQIDSEAKRPIMDEMEQMYLLYKGDHWDMIGPHGDHLRTPEQKRVHPNSVENMTFSLIEGMVSEMSDDVDLIDYPVQRQDEDAAKKMTRLKKFIMYKNKIPDEHIKWLNHFFWYGTGIWQLRWDPEWLGGKGPNRWLGDIRWEAAHPQTLFPDARCGEDIQNGYRIHKAVYRPLEYIQQHYPERGHLVMEDIQSSDQVLGILRDEDAEGYTDVLAQEGMGRLIETWYIGRPLILGIDENGGEEKDEGIGLHVITWAGENQQIYLGHKNYMYYEPGETPRFPFVFRTCYRRENSPWGYGEAYVLRNQQIITNKMSELVTEGLMHQSLGQTYYEKEALDEDQRRNVQMHGGLAGMWYDVLNIDGVRREHGQGIPLTLLSDLERRYKTMESLIGRFDISQGKTPGSVTAFRALNLLAQRAQVRLKSKELAIRTAYEECGQFCNRLISLFYNEKRTFRITGHSDEIENQIFDSFRPDDIRRVWLKGETEMVDIPAEGFEPQEDWEEGEDYEVYCPDFDTVSRVSQSMPTDRMFMLEMAQQLFSAKLITPSVFFQVIDHGRFPPWEQVEEELTEQFEKTQPAFTQGPSHGPPDQSDVAPGAPDDIAQMLAMLPPEQQAQVQAMPPEQQIQFFQEFMAQMGAQQQPGGPPPQQGPPPA